MGGSLRNAINTHGPITEKTEPSATKRVVGEVVAYLGAQPDFLALVESVRVRNLERQLKRLKHGHLQVVDQLHRLQAKDTECRS